MPASSKRSGKKPKPPSRKSTPGLTEVYAAHNQCPRALQILDAEMQKAGSSLLLKVAWGNIAARAGRLDDAIGVFQQLIDANPANFDLHMRLAESYRLKQDLPRAIDVWAKAMPLNPESLTPILARAMALDQVGRKAEALSAYNDVLTREPDNATAANTAVSRSPANLLRPLTRAHPKFLPLRIRLGEAASELAAASRLSPSPEQRAEIQRIQSQLR